MVMTNYLCGPCCFAADLEKEQRLKMYQSVNEILTVNSGLVLLCPDCDKQISIVNGVITTKVFIGEVEKLKPRKIFKNPDYEQIDLFRCAVCNKPVTACRCEDF